MKKSIVLIGGGGHCKVVIDAIENSGEFIIHGIVDPKLPKGTPVLGAKVIGKDNVLADLFEAGIKEAFISVGSIGNCDVRKRVYDNLRGIGFHLPAIVHPKAVVARDVVLGEGTFVAAGVVINSGTRIGGNAIVNTSSSIDHDCKIGNFVHVAPGVILSGGVEVGDEAHIGTGARVIQNIKIGRNCFIPAGTTLSRDKNDKK